ncbi:MAG: cache domain-containing protein [Magnetococcales bacterium]|nr:cache domain-containing protein [Magnetococcales bacterium]
MKPKVCWSLSLVGALFLWVGVGAGELLAAPQSSVEAAEARAIDQMNVMMFRIKMFHQEVKSTLRFTMELDLFKKYFSLPESAHNTVDAMGVVQFSAAQVALRQQIEAWANLLHKQFPIGEMCLIDQTGQEHLRVVQGKVEDAHFFSDTESDSPFFAPSFMAKEGEVHVSKPYMSPDSRYWVIAYTAPVVLANGEKPAFFHFEIPLEAYGKLLSTLDYGYATAHQQSRKDVEEEGRYFIISSEGLLMADSRQTISMGLPRVRARDGTDFALEERLADYLPRPSSISSDPRFLEVVERMRKQEGGIAHLVLADRSYVLVFQPIPESSWSLGHLDPVGGPGFWEGARGEP